MLSAAMCCMCRNETLPTLLGCLLTVPTYPQARDKLGPGHAPVVLVHLALKSAPVLGPVDASLCLGLKTTMLV